MATITTTHTLEAAMSESSLNTPRPSQHEDPSEKTAADDPGHHMPPQPQDEGVFAGQEWALGTRSNSTGHAEDDSPETDILDVMGENGDVGPGDLGLSVVDESSAGLATGPDRYVSEGPAAEAGE
ncbi:MAG: hypothetical protein JWM95_3109 [Gemmatimonadetes bacterium]|nr:hypothetical protein [Gemmatimonadota bacterium]